MNRSLFAARRQPPVLATRCRTKACRALIPTLTDDDFWLTRELLYHHALTTEQAAQLCEMPPRNAHYALNRLYRLGLADWAQPDTHSRSIPQHWWLTTAGRRRLGVPGRLPARWTSPQFLAHAAAVAALPLAVDRLGPAIGLHLRQWYRDGAVQQRWAGSDRWLWIATDGYALVHVEAIDAEVPLLIEVDRGDLPLARLREKLRGYLAYTAAVGWRGWHESCPVLLVLTTSEERAADLLGAAARHRKRIPGPTGELFVAVTGRDDKADEAVSAPVWRSDSGGTSLPMRTLTEALSRRTSPLRDGSRHPTVSLPDARGPRTAKPERAGQSLTPVDAG
jgi:hypothetical protein